VKTFKLTTGNRIQDFKFDPNELVLKGPLNVSKENKGCKGRSVLTVNKSSEPSEPNETLDPHNFDGLYPLPSTHDNEHRRTMVTTQRTFSRSRSSSSSSSSQPCSGSRFSLVQQRQRISLVMLVIVLAATSHRLLSFFAGTGDHSLLAAAFSRRASLDTGNSGTVQRNNDMVQAASSTGNQAPITSSPLRSVGTSNMATSLSTTLVDAAVTNNKDDQEAVINNPTNVAMPSTPLSSYVTTTAPTKSPTAPTASPMAQPPTYPTTEYVATNLATDPDYPHHRQFSDYLTGPALDSTTDDPLQEAICEFRIVLWGEHFPHVYVSHFNNRSICCRCVCEPSVVLSSFFLSRCVFVTSTILLVTLAYVYRMQQFYRCFSWWLAHPHLPAILVTGHKTKWAQKTSFIQGYLAMLRLGLNLTVVPEYHSPTSHVQVRESNGNNHTAISSDRLVLRSVQGKDTGMYEGDTALTDFAMIDPDRTLYQYAVRYLQHEKRYNEEARTDTAACPNSAKQRPKWPRIAILNRDTIARKLTNAVEMAALLSATLSRTVPLVTFDYKTDFPSQVSFFVNTDIVISPHGAQLTGMAFLPRCASVLEIFTSRYLVADYFGSLAAAVNISHGFVYVNKYADDVIPHNHRFHFVREPGGQGEPVEPNLEPIVRAVHRLVAQWQECVCNEELSHDAASRTNAVVAQ
jgi:Glycosyltransferase 61